MMEAVKRRDGILVEVGSAALDAGLCALSSGVVLQGMQPLGIAIFAAGVLSGRCVPALALGMVLGCVASGTAAGIAGALAVLAVDFLLGFVRLRIRRDAALSLLAATGSLLFGLVFADGDVLQSLLAVGIGILTYAIIPFLRAGFAGTDRIGRSLLLTASVSGLAAWSEDAGVLAAAALCSMGGGQAVALFSAGLLLAGADGWGALLPVVLAAAERMTAGWDRVRRTAALCGIGLAFGLLSGTRPGLLPFFALAAAVSAWIPEEVQRRIRSFSGTMDRTDFSPDALAEDVRRDAAIQACALADAFSELAEGLNQPIRLPDEQRLIQAMRQGLCAGCPGYAACWADGDGRAVTFLCQLISSALEADGRIFSDGVPPEAARICRRSGEAKKRLEPLLREFASSRSAELRRGAAGRLMSAQMAQAARLLGEFSARQRAPLILRDGRARQVMAEFSEVGQELEHIVEISGKYVLRLRDGTWTRETSEFAAQQLRRAMGGRFCPVGELGDAALAFRRAPGYRVRTGSLSRSAVEGSASGDSRAIRLLPDGRILLAISDGMGSGPDAAEESGLALRLLYRFLAAGIEADEAIQAANALLLSRRDDDMFATIDLCILDLSVPEAEFTKLAASRSFILRGDKLIRVDGGRLPLGVLEGVTGAKQRVKLRSGDRIVMGSDGVMDQAAGEAEEIAARSRNEAIGELLRKLMDAPSRYPDDRTLILADVFRI